GLTNRIIGQMPGVENSQLQVANLPAHTHETTVTQPEVGGVLSGTATATGTANGTGNAAGNIEIPANSAVGGAYTPRPARVLGLGSRTLDAGAAPNTNLEPLSTTLPVSVSVPVSVPVDLSQVSVDVDLTSPVAVVNSDTGSGAVFNNMQPSLTINYVIALNGVYPQRN